jgi:hypothetical protein
MNTIGKTLVVLNFLFAVIVGVFLVYDIGMRAGWKEKYQKLEQEARVMQSQHDSIMKATEKLRDMLASKDLEVEQLRSKNKDDEDARVAIEQGKNIQIADLTTKLVDKDLVVKETLLTQKRLTDEVTKLNTTIKERETMIVRLEADIKVFRIKAQNFESLATARQSQNETLLDQIRDLTNKLARIETGATPEGGTIKNPNEPNPPAVVVNGKIERVDGTDNTLIQINLGTDHGVNKYHTLDVYRTDPAPKYLGMIRIVDAYHQKSVARFVTTGNPAFRPQLKTEDLVTSKLSR